VARHTSVRNPLYGGRAEMRLVKHHFQAGVPAQRGIED
jgi:hypothetical protein